MSGTVDFRSPFAVMAELPGTLSTAEALDRLLGHLVAVSGARGAVLWRAGPAGFRPELQRSTEVSVLAADLPTLAARPEVDALAAADTGNTVVGAVTLSLPGAELDAAGRSALDDTAVCAAALWRLDDLRSGLAEQESHTDRLAGQLSAAALGLDTVRDLERRRVAAEIIMLSTGPLTELRARVDSLQETIATGDALPGAEAAAGLLPELDDLIENFRTMVRGIHPIVLQTRGPKAAIAEMAAGLDHPVRINGSLPRRIEAELGSAVYHFASAAVQALARTDGDATIEVTLGRVDGRFEVVVSGETAGSVAALRAAVAVDVDRFSALGGDVAVTVQEGVTAPGAVATLRGRLPDRLEPPARPRQQGVDAALPGRVHDLALRVTARYGDGPGVAAAQALVPRLEGPVRVGIRGFADDYPPQLRALAQRTPEIYFQEYPSDPVVMGDVDAPDAILEPADPGGTGSDPGSDSARVQVLLAGPGAGVLIPPSGWEVLPGLIAREVLARADLLRSRSVLAAATEVLRRYPFGDPDDVRLGYQVERLRAQAHELVELEALCRLRAGPAGLSRAQVRAAERLLGAEGTAPHERLSVPAASTVEELKRAATAQMQPWRDIAKYAVNRRQRETGAAVVRSCERLLAVLAANPRTDPTGAFAPDLRSG